MMEIEKPRILCEESSDSAYAKITVEPLERGFGITLGNTLRRVLLSSLPGAAVVGIKIDGVMHEFSTIKGVTEDVAEIILNLKNLHIKLLTTDKSVKKSLRLVKNAPGTVTARDIDADPEVEILNPDFYICTMDAGAKIDMELIVGRGRGYVAADKNKNPALPIGYIPIDSIFTPVKKINYEVESTRVGQNIDYDKLILEVWTHGTMSAREIVSLSAKIVEDHIRLFVNLSENMAALDILQNPAIDRSKAVLEMNIEDMDLSVRSYNCLKRAGIHTVEDLTKKTEDDMLKVRNLGRKSLDEVIHKLQRLGLDLKPKEE
ncbi:MAG: DNA-directed RNA polymerase subunit alpha [Clostridiales bacterium]|jgi:DNA-directed RNA polymerase subunit alpha|nr:DNA-directed RNA polymerase subunit alpha [Clostridiales bacterium]